MACEICGRNSCTRSFHALDEQKAFDEVADNVKDRMKAEIKREVERLKDRGENENEVLVSLADVLSAIDSCN
jgi:hypothetical protein